MSGRVVALVALALGYSALSRASGDLLDPAGELWIVSSPAQCPGVDGTLFDYEGVIHAHVTSVMDSLARKPRLIDTRAGLLEALQRRALRGWLFLFISGHGVASDGTSRVCLGDGSRPGDWLDIDRDLLPALPTSLSGAVVVLDSCSSAHVDPRLARIPTTIISASPYVVDASALFGTTILASLSAAIDDNCNGVFDDDDLFSGATHRLSAALSFVAFEAWPKLRRNAPSPLPLPVRARPSSRCVALASTAETVPAAVLPTALVNQRGAQAALARGKIALPRLDHDFFVVADGADPNEARILRSVATTAGLGEIHGVDATQAVALAATTTFADIYKLEPSFGWLRTWRLRDGSLVSVVRMRSAACGLPSRTVLSGPELVVPGLTPRYSQAVRYLRDVQGSPPGPATACFEPEGQCFVASPRPLQLGECDRDAIR